MGRQATLSHMVCKLYLERRHIIRTNLALETTRNKQLNRHFRAPIGVVVF